MARGGRHGQRGAAAVEFAIVLPLLVLILFGIVDFSILMYDKALITSASREGARFGGVFTPDPPGPPTCAQIYTAAIQSYEQALVTFGGPKTISRSCSTRVYDGASGTFGAWASGTCVHHGDQIAVETSFPYTFLAIPDFVTSITGPLTLRSVTIMRCE